MVINIILAIFLLGLIILFHEFGHFIVAKANGVCVIEFSIGFGPRLFSVRKGDTDYCLKALPFGGSCRMLSADEELYELTEEQKESKGHEFEKQSMKMIRKHGKAAALESKSVSARIAISLAGPVYNFILAFVLAIVMIGFMGYDTTRVDSVTIGSDAYEQGLREGDIITNINGKNVVFAREISQAVKSDAKSTLRVTYERDGQSYTTEVTPTESVEDSYKIGTSISQDGVIASVSEGSPAEKAGIKANDKVVSVNGILTGTAEEIINEVGKSDGQEVKIVVERGGTQKEYKVTPIKQTTTIYDTGFVYNGKREKTSPLKTIYYGLREVWYWINLVLSLLGQLFTGQLSINNLSGPVGTVSAISNVVEKSKSGGAFLVVMNLLYMGIMLSANIGIMNLIPIPALDGGRLLILIFEAVMGRPIAKGKEAVIDFIGVVFVVLLMFFVLVKDIVRLF